MADQQPQTAAPKNETKYFRTPIAGLSVVVEPARDGEIAPHVVRFTPILERWEGEMQKFGYLKTSNKVAIRKCKEDPNVSEIEAEEYEKVLANADDGNKPNVRRASL